MLITWFYLITYLFSLGKSIAKIHIIILYSKLLRVKNS